MSESSSANVGAAPDDRLHELLCALVLGEELSPFDRLRVERALAASPEWRAERERIAATVALVGDALDASGQRLSAAASARLLAAADAERPSRMAVAESLATYHGEVRARGAAASGSWRAAASLLVFLGGGLLAFSVLDGRSPSESDERLASADDLRTKREFAPTLDAPFGGKRVVHDDPYRGVPADSVAYDFDPVDAAAAKLGEPPANAQRVGDSGLEAREGAGELAPPAEGGEVSGGVAVSFGGKKTKARGAPSTSRPPLAAGTPSAATASTSGLLRDRVAGHGGNYRSPNTSTPPDPSTTGTGGEASRIRQLGRVVLGVEFESAEEDVEGGLPFRLPASPDVSIGAIRIDSSTGLGQGDEGAVDEADIPELAAAILEWELVANAPAPDESPRALYFRLYGEHPFVEAAEDPLSTFAADVDDASYLRCRARLLADDWPAPSEVRTEEFVNHPAPDVEAPSDAVFRIACERTPAPFAERPDRQILRVALRAREVAAFEREPLALTFVVDVSGSMDEPDRLPLVQDALRRLVETLDGRDSIAVVAFSEEARVVLPMTSARQRAAIGQAILGLRAEGGTNAEAGLRAGYELAVDALAPGAIHRVVLLSDGIANLGETDQERIAQKVARERESGIYLNTIGVGMEAGGDAFLEQLADRGDGVASYMANADQARRALVDNFTGAFVPVARDVKIQVEFDPARVVRWRQLGYENRAIADQAFRDDTVDAGEIGAGHQVVCLYEIEPGPEPAGDLGTVRVRWKSPVGGGRTSADEVASEIAVPIDSGTLRAHGAATDGFRRSVLLARFAEVLRGSVHVRGLDLARLVAEGEQLAPRFGDPEFDDLLSLLRRAEAMAIARAHDVQPDLELSELREALRRNALRSAEVALARTAEGAGILDAADADDDPAEVDLAREREDVAARLRALYETRLREAQARGEDLGSAARRLLSPGR